MDFQQLLRDQEEDRAQQNAEHAKLFKSSLKRNLIFGSVGVVTLALFATLAFYNPFTPAPSFGNNDVKQVSTGATPQTIVAPEWFQETDNKFPAGMELEQWQKTSYAKQNEADLANQILSSEKSYSVVNAALILPSVTTGYTDVAADAFNADGSVNVLYSLWTQENFSASTLAAVQRLINPTFGDWVEESRTGDLATIKSKLADLFTGDFITNDSPLPVLTDFTEVAGFTLGDALPKNGTGWTGSITDQSVEFAYDQSVQNYTARYTANVAYSIWKNDRTVVTTHATLTLTLVPNHDAKNQTDRVLISEATLTLEEGQ